MPHVVLYEPEIPPNTGNIIRLCANLGFDLHLIEPLGFTLDDARLRRAGLDYHELACVSVHASMHHYLAAVLPARVLPLSTRGETRYTACRFEAGDALLFGPETRGLPAQLLQRWAPGLHIPMRAGARSLNLSNSVAIVAYEAWRQLGFDGAHTRNEKPWNEKPRNYKPQNE